MEVFVKVSRFWAVTVLHLNINRTTSPNVLNTQHIILNVLRLKLSSYHLRSLLNANGGIKQTAARFNCTYLPFISNIVIQHRRRRYRCRTLKMLAHFLRYLRLQFECIQFFSVSFRVNLQLRIQIDEFSRSKVPLVIFDKKFWFFAYFCSVVVAVIGVSVFRFLHLLRFIWHLSLYRKVTTLTTFQSVDTIDSKFFFMQILRLNDSETSFSFIVNFSVI